MSSIALAWAHKQAQNRAVPRRSLAMLMTLASWANDEHAVWRSKAVMAKEMGISKRSVCNYLSDLQKAGLIYIERRFRGGAEITSRVTLNVANANKTRCASLGGTRVQALAPELTTRINKQFSQSRKPGGRERLPYTREGVTRTHADVSAHSSVSMCNAAEAAGADFEAVSGYPSQEVANPRQRAATELLGAFQPRPLGWSAALLARAAAVEPVPEPVIPSGWDCDGEGF